MPGVLEEGELTAEDILTFGPVVEAATWTPIWLQEKRAPIAVAAGRPKLGRIFDEQGVGKAVVIRPCMSRGKRIRGLPPIYAPTMLEGAAKVFDGWPMFMDHVPAEVAEKVARNGRSVKELGGQLLNGWWQPGYVHEDDEEFGYQPGAVQANIWATPLIRETVGENPNLLHTSINAWPTSGKPGAVPWRPKVKGMMIEGIRRVPQGSVDFVVRGGAGGRLLAESAGTVVEGEPAWPEAGWTDEATALVVSVAERFYSSGHAMQIDLTKITKPEELRAALTEHAAHLLPALTESEAGHGPGTITIRAAETAAPAAAATPALTESDVQGIVERALAAAPKAEDIEQTLRESFEETLEEREEQRTLASAAAELIESAEGIPASWKADLTARYAMQPTGAPPALLVEEVVEDGVTKDKLTVLTENVKADLDHSRELIAEATGKPRVTGEGGKKPDTAGGEKVTEKAETPLWRTRFAEMGLAESEEKAIEVYGGKVEG